MQINRALINGAPPNPIKLIQNILDNAIQNRQRYPFLDKVDLMNSISSSRKHKDTIDKSLN